MTILKILVCTMNPKPCFSSWNFPIIVLHGISTIEVNWFNPKLLFDLPRNYFAILELSWRCALFTIFLAQLLATLKVHFDIQLWILCTLIFNLQAPKFCTLLLPIVFSRVGTTPFSEGTPPFWVPPLPESNLKSYPPLSNSHPNWCM